MITAQQALQIKHYLRHNDQKCVQCNNGFNLIHIQKIHIK